MTGPADCFELKKKKDDPERTKETRQKLWI